MTTRSRLDVVADAAAGAVACMRHEARAIDAAADRLDADAFERACRLIAECGSTVAVAGAGTSGIVARKIAATFTSTGTPALFVHPADALHGGLGLIGSQALVIAVSNGGESEELLALLPYLSSRRVPVIAVVGRIASTLGRAAEVVLDAGVAAEADRHDLVPTASVAAALAVADALALAVMGMKGVTPEGFAANHPSGRLGRRLTLRVRDVLPPGSPPAALWADAGLVEATTVISAGGAGAAVVLDGDRLAGLVTDGDIRRVVEQHGVDAMSRLRVDDFMTTDPITVKADCMAYDALRLMEDRRSQIATLPVLDEGRYFGLLRIHDLARRGL